MHAVTVRSFPKRLGLGFHPIPCACVSLWCIFTLADLTSFSTLSADVFLYNLEIDPMMVHYLFCLLKWWFEPVNVIWLSHTRWDERTASKNPQEMMDLRFLRHDSIHFSYIIHRLHKHCPTYIFWNNLRLLGFAQSQTNEDFFRTFVRCIFVGKVSALARYKCWIGITNKESSRKLDLRFWGHLQAQWTCTESSEQSSAQIRPLDSMQSVWCLVWHLDLILVPGNCMLRSIIARQGRAGRFGRERGACGAPKSGTSLNCCSTR